MTSTKAEWGESPRFQHLVPTVRLSEFHDLRIDFYSLRQSEVLEASARITQTDRDM